ncbi:hypothetical protein BDW02DRAFT_326278 [Decorospora gaudefroyi]|uniref:Uncharacterized protein n=1 Tax=Decorospora gaudefroyi TaxID=184978 RepID=A0A6A5KEB1_9PLEO|nr:hypothetical protein BDW02DRAFT_326278 [Decorospora gaudefroyi]
MDSNADGNGSNCQHGVDIGVREAGIESAVIIPKRQQSSGEGKIPQITASSRSLSFQEQEKERKHSIPALIAKCGVSSGGKTFSDHASSYGGNWTIERRNMQSRVEAHRVRLERATAHIANLEGEIGRMGAEREALESDLRSLQQHVFQRFESPDWTPASNADIRHKLSQLDSEVKTWSKANSILHLHVLNATDHPVLYGNLRAALHGFAQLENETSLQRVPDDKAWVLVQAYIMHRIYFDVFDHPFFGVGSNKFKPIDISSINEADDDLEYRMRKAEEATREFGFSMQTFYHKLRTCNVQEAVAWRVQSLRQLYPPTQDGDPLKDAKQELCTDTIRHRKRAVEILTSRYLSSGIRALLLEPDQAKLKERLSTIISTAADISYSLYTQKIDLYPQGLKHIQGTFQHSHGLMSAHQLHSKHLDDDPAQLDNMPILLMTHPALVRLDDEDGAGSIAKTVLKKAVCWMGQISEGA